MNLEIYSDQCTEHDRVLALKLKGPILVIGASGFIGAKFFFYLCKHREDVFAGAPSPTSSWRLRGNPWLNQCIPFDISDERQVGQVLKKMRPQTVFNLSAYGAYEHQSNPSDIYRVNTIGVLNIISCLQQTGCDAFIQAGSSSEYGLNCKAPLESDQLRPNSDYAVSKASAALMLQYYGQIQKFPCQNLRLYSIYGPWEEPGRLIPALVANGLNGKLPNFAAAEITRDFVYVDDCIGAFLRSAVVGCHEAPGASINISTGRQTSIAQVAEITKRIFDVSDSPQFGSMPNRRWDLSNWYGDPTLAKKLLGWSPSTDFETGLKLTAAWARKAADVLSARTTQEIARSKKVSAIIACYKDHQAIPLIYQRLTDTFQKIGVEYEIIFVNDRSPTDDEKIIRQLCEADGRVVGISHSRNFGSQAAFYSGMSIATGDAVVLMDGDLQDPPEIIPELVEKWNGGFDVVYGIRVKREAAWHMQLLYKLFYRVFSKLSDISIPVDAGDFSLIDRKAVNQLLALPEKDVFLRGLRAWVGYKQAGVPYIRPERAFGRSTNSFFKNIWWAKKGIFSFSTKPLSYLQGMGVVMFAASLALAVFYTILHFVHPGPRGFTTIIILCLGVGGLQLLSIGVIGDYIGKVLEEVKNRPRYIRAAIFRHSKAYTSQKEIESFAAEIKEILDGKHS